MDFFPLKSVRGCNDGVSLYYTPPSMQYSLHVFEQLMAAGQNYGMKLAGAYALDTLRLEKGFRHWSHELDTETTPLEAGLGFAVDMKKVLWNEYN